MMTNDECFELSLAVQEKWGRAANARGPAAIPFESRVILLVSNVTAVVANGGFEYLLEGTWPGDEDLEHSVTAFKTIDCVEASNIIAFVMSHFKMHSGSSSLEPQERKIALDSAFPEESKRELNRPFWKLLGEIETKFNDYLRLNQGRIKEQLALNPKELESFKK
jgi:hypothetical protein